MEDLEVLKVLQMAEEDFELGGRLVKSNEQVKFDWLEIVKREDRLYVGLEFLGLENISLNDT